MDNVLWVRIVGNICNPWISGFHLIGVVFLEIIILTHAYPIMITPNPHGINQYCGVKCLVVPKTTSTPGV